MGYTMHDAIRTMLEGRNLIEPVQFEPGEDLAAYHRYIPGLCELLRKASHSFELYHPGTILIEIMPPRPEPFIINLLLKQLPHNFENGTLILKLLAKVEVPETVDIAPILRMLDDPYYKYNAVMALKGTHHPAAEEAVLDLLREEAYTTPELAGLYCETLAAIGSIRSLPILMATSKDFTEATTKAYFNQAIEQICQRAGLPEELRKKMADPSFWKVTWQGTPESFAGFIDFLSLFMVGAAPDASMTDKIAEIFMREMEVDISPYGSFEALRLCSDESNMLEGLQHMRDNLESEVLLHAVTETEGILPSSETMAKDLYMDLMNDYLMTRLRRHINFSGK